MGWADFDFLSIVLDTAQTIDFRVENARDREEALVAANEHASLIRDTWVHGAFPSKLASYQ
jgi:hypothetical protein